ncbi:MAG: hypothetical protein D6820_05065, partial [Lentisphaerae bacterium]
KGGHPKASSRPGPYRLYALTSQAGRLQPSPFPGSFEYVLALCSNHKQKLKFDGSALLDRDWLILQEKLGIWNQRWCRVEGYDARGAMCFQGSAQAPIHPVRWEFAWQGNSLREIRELVLYPYSTSAVVRLCNISLHKKDLAQNLRTSVKSHSAHLVKENVFYFGARTPEIHFDVADLPEDESDEESRLTISLEYAHVGVDAANVCLFELEDLSKKRVVSEASDRLSVGVDT